MDLRINERMNECTNACFDHALIIMWSSFPDDIGDKLPIYHVIGHTINMIQKSCIVA